MKMIIQLMLLGLAASVATATSPAPDMFGIINILHHKADPDDDGEINLKELTSIYEGMDEQKSYSCPAGWYFFIQGAIGSCIKYYSNATTWTGAREACQEKGGDLVRVSDDKVSSFTASVLSVSKAKVDAFIGINDIAENGRYVWLDEKKNATYLNWNSNEPSGDEDKNCGIIKIISGYDLLWSTVSCSSHKGYVCQQKAERHFSVNRTEFVNTWKGLTLQSTEMSDAYFDLSDTDHNGIIDDKDTKNIFHRFDKDQDGLISDDEFVDHYSMIFRIVPFVVLFRRVQARYDTHHALHIDMVDTLFDGLEGEVNGSMSKASLEKAWVNEAFGTAKDADSVMALLDTDDDDVISTSELEAHFKRLDKDGDGHLTLDELRMALVTLNPKPTEPSQL